MSYKMFIFLVDNLIFNELLVLSLICNCNCNNFILVLEKRNDCRMMCKCLSWFL